MAGTVMTLLKKIFSIALILNALITICGVIGILNYYYSTSTEPYPPYALSGNLFILAIIAGLVNIFPSAAIGRVLHTGRFLFHHYVYGFLVLSISSVFITFFTPVSLFNLFLVDSSGVDVTAGRFFLLGGLALLLDDLPDVSMRTSRFLDWLKLQAYKARKALFAIQLATGAVTFYLAAAIIVFTIQNPARALPDAFLVSSLLITSITSLALAKRKDWLKIQC
ncbi:MAG: hypothetical protein ACFCUE_09715 [Candidatus Bathyarchaeia archaeon]|jgi:hypothetical protein